MKILVVAIACLGLLGVSGCSLHHHKADPVVVKG